MNARYLTRIAHLPNKKISVVGRLVVILREPNGVVFWLPDEVEVILAAIEEA